MAEVDILDPNRKVKFENGEHPALDSSNEQQNETRPRLKKKSSLKSISAKRLGGSVSFLETVTVRELPSEEADEAKSTRKGGWEAAPEHDELWDGHSKDFWEEEKSIDEVRRIVVVRQMRMALEYNLGYAFYAMVSNFKKRHQLDEDPAMSGMIGMEDVVPEFDTPGAEETAIRKEIRELFADSVKGLDFPDLVQDREAFDKLYATTVINISEAKRMPGLGLLRIEELVDEIMNSEEICRMLGILYVKPEAPKKDKAELEAQERIETAVVEVEKRRGDRRASIEAHHPHVSPQATERRASVDARRRASIDPKASAAMAVAPQSLGNAPDRTARRPSMESKTEATPERRPSVQAGGGGRDDLRRLSFTVEDPARRSSFSMDNPLLTAQGGERRPSITPSERRPSLTTAQSVTERRGSLQSPAPTPEVLEEDVPIFTSAGRTAVRGGRVPIAVPRPAVRVSDPADQIEVKEEEMSPVVRRQITDSKVIFALLVVLGLLLMILDRSQRAFHVSSAIESRINVRGSGIWGIAIPLLIVLGVVLLTAKTK